MKYYKLIIVGFSALFSVSVYATDLSNLAVFNRCYGQLTQTQAPVTSTIYQNVKSGALNPITACLQVLDSARSNTMNLPNVSDPTQQAVLGTMHKLHASWFENRSVPEIGNAVQNNASRGIYDASNPALYYTRALFDTTVDISYVSTTADNLIASRTDNNPTTSILGAARDQFIFRDDANFTFPAKGALTGIRVSGPMTRNYAYTGRTGSISLGQTLGGGVMGTPTYLLTSVQEEVTPAFRADGAIQMPRKWARGVFHDLLCRSLPVVRQADAAASVLPATNAPEFRQSITCNTCHVSMDRMAGVIRNFSYQAHGSNTVTPQLGGYHVAMQATTQTATDDGWANVATTNFYQRPTRGTLYLRDYRGNLVNQALTGAPDLGNKIAALDDFYICAAKRYYAYFMGIDVYTGDIGDPLSPVPLTTIDLAHRDRVIALGLELKTHKNPRRTIESILNLPGYRKSDPVEGR